MNVKQNMSFFFLVSIVLNMGANFAHPVTPTIFKSLGMKDYLFGYALAAMMIANFLFSPFWGKINAMFSCRKSLLITCIGYGVGQLCFGVARTAAQILLVRAFTGIFIGGVFVSLLNYVVNVSETEEQRGKNLIISATIQAVSGAFGFFAGGMLGEITPRLAILCQGFVLIGAGFLFLIVCKDDRTPAAQAALPRAISGVIKEANPFLAFVASRTFMTKSLAVFFLVCIFHAVGQIAFDQSFNYYITDQFQLSSGYNGAFKAAMGTITLTANTTICAHIIKKRDIGKALTVVMLLGAVTMGMVLLFAKSLPGFLLFNILFFAFCSICLPLLQNIVAGQARNKDSNLVMGFFNSMKSLGGILGAALSGTLYASLPTGPFILCAAVFLLGAICAAVSVRMLKKTTEG